MGGLILTAQALDNLSTNPFYVNGVWLMDEDANDREVAMSRVSAVSRNGKVLKKGDGIKLIKSGPSVLVEVLCEESDTAGRGAPILCCGEWIPSKDPDRILAAIQNFADDIGRSISVERFHILSSELIRSNPAADATAGGAWFTRLRSSKSRILVYLILIAVALILVSTLTPGR